MLSAGLLYHLETLVTSDQTDHVIPHGSSDVRDEPSSATKLQAVQVSAVKVKPKLGAPPAA